MIFLYILLLVFSCTPVAAFQNASFTHDTQGTFKMGPMNDVVFTQGLLFETSAASLTDCGQKCLNLRECVTYTFKVSHHIFPAGTCRLHRQFHSVQDENQKQAGANNFALDKSESRCPYQGYTMQAGRCIQLVSDLLNYQDATQRCQSLQEGHLFHTKTLADVEFALKITLDNGFHRVWLGADNLAVPGQYQWTDGTPLLTNNSLWSLDEPNEVTGGCLVMHDFYTRLDDIPCVKVSNPMCQKD